MQTPLFSVSRSTVVHGNANPVEYIPFGQQECDKIWAGLRMMLNFEEESPHLLIPLGSNNGRDTYIAVVRREFEFSLAEYRVRIRGESIRWYIKPVSVSDHVKREFPHVKFEVRAPVVHRDHVKLFWNVMHTSCDRKLESIYFGNPDRVGDVEDWNLSFISQEFGRFSYGHSFKVRIMVALREMCLSSSATAIMLVSNYYDAEHFIALSRNGNTINAMDLNVKCLTSPFNVIFQGIITFPPNTGTLINKAFEFVSVELTDAQLHALLQKPVWDYYKAKQEHHLSNHLCRVAVAMFTHPRLNERASDTLKRLTNETVGAIISYMK